MIKLADLPVEWQNDSTAFAEKFVCKEDGASVMSFRFEKRMPECYGVKYAHGDHFLSNDVGQSLCANPDWSKAVAYCTPRCDNDYVLPLAAVCARFSFYDVLLAHASLVDYNGLGVMFTGPSGVGKTTQAQLWNKFLDADIINGDKVFVRKNDDEFYAYGLPWRGSSEYCLNKKVPLKGIVVLRQSEGNRITRLALSAEMLMPHIFLPHWDENAVSKALDTFDNLVNSVPVYLLECRPDEEAVRITFDEILNNR